MTVLDILRFGRAWAAKYRSKYQIPYRMIPRRELCIVRYRTAGGKNRELLTIANTEKSIYLTVQCYRYAEYRVPTRYQGNYLPYRLFVFEIPLPRTPLIISTFRAL